MDILSQLSALALATCHQLLNLNLLSIPDFGMMGEFKQEFRDGFIEACLHLVNRDYSSLAKDFVTLGYYYYLHYSKQGPFLILESCLVLLHICFDRLIPPTSDKAAVTEALTGFVLYFDIY